MVRPASPTVFAESFAPGVATKAPKWVNPDFEARDKIFRMSELQVEEVAGFGFGACALLAVGVVMAMRAARRNGEKMPRITRQQAWLFIATAVALVVFLQASFTGSSARLLTPYYPLVLVPFLLHPGQRYVVQRKWWRLGAIATSALVAALLMLNPARPLFPAEWLLKVLRQNGGSGRLLARAETVYSVYALRSDGFAPAR